MINKKISIRLVCLYVLPYVVLLMVFFGLMIVYPKPELHLLLNSYHSDFLDVFFKYYTLLAEFPLYLLALLPLLWKIYKITLFFAMCELTGGTFLQLLKHTICLPRPVKVFEDYPDLVLPLVQGVDMHHSNSFPSGHASTFFMFCTCCVIVLAYYYSRKDRPAIFRSQILFDIAMVVLLVLAVLGAFSRVYLSQHFLSDVCAGSIIGLVTPFLMFYLCRNKVLKLNKEEQ